MYQPPKCPHSYFSRRFEFYLGCFFPVSILKEHFWKAASGMFLMQGFTKRKVIQIICQGSEIQ